MGSVIYDSRDSIRRLLDHGFEMPIHFAAVGADGSVVAGTYSPSGRGGVGFDCQITLQSEGKSLIPPVNIMYVDCRGESALIVVRQQTESHI
jgi:hypothetical protein